MLEELGSGQDLYTQIFRAQIGSWFRAYTEARRAWPWAGAVYSDFQGPGRLLVWGVYNRLEKPALRQNQYTQKVRIRAGSWSKAYTCILKKPGIRNLLSWLSMNLHGLSFYLAIPSIQ